MNSIKRYHLLDCLRLASMFAIIIFHCGEFIFFNDKSIGNPSFIYNTTTYYARLIPFSGHSIIFLSFLLWGLTKKKITLKLYYIILFFFGHFVINFSFSDNFTDIMNWDIYPFLFVSFLAIIAISNLSRSIKKIISIASLILLFIPTHFFHFQVSSDLLADCIYGACQRGLSGSWPLLPWIALPIFAYTSGSLLSNYKKELSVLTLKEVIFWTFSLVISLCSIYFIYPWSLFNVPIGANFYCFMLNLRPTEFWSYFFPFLFLLRISFLRSLNVKLNSLSFFNYISKLHWNTHFGLTYVCHIFILFIFSYFSEYYTQSLYLYDLSLISIIPLSEILARILNSLLKD